MWRTSLAICRSFPDRGWLCPVLPTVIHCYFCDLHLFLPIYHAYAAYPLVICYIAISDFPINIGDFP